MITLNNVLVLINIDRRNSQIFVYFKHHFSGFLMTHLSFFVCFHPYMYSALSKLHVTNSILYFNASVKSAKQDTSNHT